MTQACTGLTKHHLREYGGPRRTKFILKSRWTSAVAQYLWNSNEKELALCLMVSLEFILRVQSEGLKVHFGYPTVLTEKVGWSASIWVEKDGSLHVSLKRRKSKPEGSHIVRSCMCLKKKLCAPCAFAKLLAGAQYGQLLWDFRLFYVLSRERQSS